MKNKNGIEINDELIVKYLAGEAGPDEAELLHDWLSVPENQLYFEEFQNTWSATHPSKKYKQVSSKDAWNEISNKVNSGSTPMPTGLQVSTFFLKVAASLLMVVTCGIFLYYFLREEQSVPETTIFANVDSKTVTLPDSSKVVLYRHSSVSYSQEFGSLTREIKFSGEGFFRVKGNAGKPFVIHTALADIKVIGTVFNVSLATDQLEVSVEEGNVMVLSKTDSVVLQPGHAAIVRGLKNSINITNTIDINKWAYATHKFVFQDTPLEQVFQQIEKAYPYVIRLTNRDIKNCKLTATFDQVSAPEILNLIGETLDLTVQENDNTFQIEGKGCPWDH